MTKLNENLDYIKKVCQNLCQTKASFCIFLNQYLEVTKVESSDTKMMFVKGIIRYIDHQGMRTDFLIPKLDIYTIAYQTWVRYKEELPCWNERNFEYFEYMLETANCSKEKQEIFNELFSKCHKECDEHELDYKIQLLKEHHLNSFFD